MIRKILSVNFFVLLICCQFLRSGAVITAVSDIDFSNCSTILNNRIEVFYQDFTFLLQCDNSGYTLKPGDTSKCVVAGQSIFQLSSQSIIVNTTTADFLLYQIINETRCVSRQAVQVLLQELQNVTCEQDFRYALDNQPNVRLFSIDQKNEFVLPCTPDNFERDIYSTYPVTKINPSDYKTIWRYTRFNQSLQPYLEDPAMCVDYVKEENRYGVVEKASLISQPYAPPSLKKIDVDFWDSGLYSCELSYKDKLLYYSHAFVCVQRTLNLLVKPSLNCETVIYFFEGNSVTLSCSTRISIGKLNPSDLYVSWNKVSSAGNHQVCENKNLETVSPSPNLNAHCNLKNFENQERICYLHRASPQELSEQQPAIKSFDVTFTIRDLKKSDAGIYTVQLTHLNVSTEVSLIELNFDASIELQILVVRLCVSLGAMVVIILTAFLIWYNKIQILLFVRRHAGKYDRDNYMYVGLLAYYNEQQNFLGKQRLRKIVPWIKERMEKMNFSFLDPNESFTEGNALDIIIKNLENCHRLIVILTVDLVQHRMTCFQIQQAYRDMLQNKRKIIFITTKDAIKKLKEVGNQKKGDNNDLYKELNAAVKACRKIPFTDNMAKERFQDHVEYALPKLNRQDELPNLI